MNSSDLITILKSRFENNMHRHDGVAWSTITKLIEAHPDLVRSLQAMESTGGEPDVIVIDSSLVYIDCSQESPQSRRSLCYDQDARTSRKANAPASSAMEAAHAMGVTIATEAQYRALQSYDSVDTTTSSWLLTPPNIRERGGALFGDRRYDAVFVYHNGVQSYYAARGFRGAILLSQ